MEWLRNIREKICRKCELLFCYEVIFVFRTADNIEPVDFTSDDFVNTLERMFGMCILHSHTSMYIVKGKLF